MRRKAAGTCLCSCPTGAYLVIIRRLFSADSGGWRSAFRTDVDHHSEVMPISVPN